MNNMLYLIIVFTDTVSPDHFVFLIPISMLRNTLTAKKLMTINHC